MIKDKLFLDMIWCPPGSFTDSNKQNRTIEKGFFLAQYELTMHQYGFIKYEYGQDSTGYKGLYRYREQKPQTIGYDREATKVKEFLRLLQERVIKSGLIPKDWEFTIPTREEWIYVPCRN